MIVLRIAAAGLGLALALAGTARADDDHGRGWKGRKYEYRYGACKYEFKRGPHGYKEEYKCKEPRGHFHRPPVVVWGAVPTYRAYPAYPVYAPPPPPAVYPPQTYVEAVPMRNFQDEGGRYCREYQRMATIGGRQQQIYGTACLMPDGAWQIVSE